MMTRAFVFLCLGVAVLTGCGYTTGSLLPSSYQNIHVAAFENKVDFLNQEERKLYIPGLETKVRGAVIDRYQFDGNLRVGEFDAADMILKGQLLGFEREELRLNRNEDVREYRLRITVAFTMEDPADQTILWTEPSFSGESTYFVSGPQAKSESAAIEDAIKDLATRIVARTIEVW